MISFGPPATSHDLIVFTQCRLPGDVLVATRITFAARIDELDGLDRLTVELSQASTDHRQFT